MNPTPLRSWIRKYGNVGVLCVACLIGLRHLWKKRRALLVSSFAFCVLIGFCWHNHTANQSQQRQIQNRLTAQSKKNALTSAQSSTGLDTLAADLRAGLKQYPDSYQRFLWRSYHLANDALEGKEWVQIEPALKAQGFQIENRGTAGSSTRYEVTLEGLTYQLPSGPKHEIVIDFDVSPQVSRTIPTRMTIRNPCVRLHAKFNRPLSEVARNSPYPKGSILDAFLNLPALRKGVANYSLEAIELEYHRPLFSMGMCGEYYAPYGYLIIADFEHHEHNLDHSKRVLYDAPSGLDPEESWGGKKFQPADFVSNDTFGPISIFGGGGGESVGGPAMGGLIERVDRKEEPDREPGDLRTAYSIADLRSFPANTTALRLMDSYLTNEDLAELARFHSLTYLDMLQCEGDPNDPFNEQGLQALAKLTNLTHLVLSGKGVTDRLCETLSGLKGLNYLYISQGDISDAGIHHLTVLSRLETFEVPYCERLTDASLHSIGTMRNLRHLNILSCGEFSDTGLNALGNLNQLEDLTIGGLKHANSHGFAFLSHTPALTELFLGYMPLDDNTLEYVSQRTQLKSLTLRELSGITDAGIQRLHTLDHVEWLSIDSCPKVTPTGMTHLKEALPGKYEMD